MQRKENFSIMTVSEKLSKNKDNRLENTDKSVAYFD